jgi:endoglucanase
MRVFRALLAIAWTAVIAGVAAPQAAVARVTDPFSPGTRLYVDPSEPSARQAREWRKSRPADARLMDRIATRPVATWLGDWNARVRDDAADVARRARLAKAVPVVVAYNIPQRDCGSYSAGGARSEESYARWIGDVGSGLGRGPAAVILEPDAVAGWGCLDDSGRERRARMLRDATTTLARRGIAVYLDAGNSNWQPPATMAARLRSAGIAQARGVAVNVSNFRTTSESISYVRALRRRLPGLRAVIDTSRNGRGPAAAAQWCNPPGRGLGRPPTVSPASSPLDALLWIKTPGESDGTCNGGPAAGVWWPEQALELARNASAKRHGA